MQNNAVDWLLQHNPAFKESVKTELLAKIVGNGNIGGEHK